MPEEPSKVASNEPFSKVLDPEIEQFLQNLVKEGALILDMDAKKTWVKGLLGKGLSLKMIQTKLSEFNYDFDAANKYFNEMTVSKEKAETAIAGVEQLKEEKVADEKKKKFVSRLGLILVAYILGGTGFFTWRMMGQTTAQIGDVSLLGSAGDMLTSFSKGSFIVGVAGVFVGLLLTIFVVADKLKKDKGENKPVVDKAKTEETVKQIQQEIASAEQTSQQKLEPPKLVQ